MRVEIQHKFSDFQIGFSFQGSEDGITAIYGKSGSGKSSIIRAICGLLKPDSGYVKINNKVLFSSKDNINIPPHNRQLGCIFQDSLLFPHLSVKSNLFYGYKRTSQSKRFIESERVIQVLGIKNLLDRYPAKLSGGEKQRISIGRALLMSPSALLMDEPLNSLDSARKKELLPFIKEINSEFKIPILYVSHFMDEIEFLTDNTVTIDVTQ